ncbi:MAG: hypothetical protein HS111_13215 [Kofleriaceae bacterium]|nr:hypothetical protein [Kofleriaceae bacterium]MCL4228029.1 hypothetical protein [Myxococcales bacterium]
MSKLFWLIAIAVIVLAIVLIRCAGGFGVGKGGDQGLAGRAPRALRSDLGVDGGPAAAPARCAVRVDASGVSLGGAPATVVAVVTACQATSGADVVVAGDARQGTWDELRGALEAGGVPVLVRGAGAPPADAGVAAP